MDNTNDTNSTNSTNLSGDTLSKSGDAKNSTPQKSDSLITTDKMINTFLGVTDSPEDESLIPILDSLITTNEMIKTFLSQTGQSTNEIPVPNLNLTDSSKKIQKIVETVENINTTVNTINTTISDFITQQNNLKLTKEKETQQITLIKIIAFFCICIILGIISVESNANCSTSI
jgi:uncharacterized membrane protein